MEPNRTYTVIIGTEEILLENIHTIGTQEEQEAFAPPPPPPQEHANMPSATPPSEVLPRRPHRRPGLQGVRPVGHFMVLRSSRSRHYNLRRFK